MTTTSEPLEGIPLATGEHPPLPGAVKLKVLNDGAGFHHSARTKARKAALDLLYEAESRDLDPMTLLAEREVREFTAEIVQGVAVNLAQIDQRITESAHQDWTLDRMPALDRNLARIAIWELDHTDTSAQAVISEALNLADEYSTDNSVAFLNGLLAQAALTHP
jgi:N utilization substance protein B